MNVISTFAGFGGSSTGYKAAGCNVLAMVEWERHAVECYELNHPTTKILHGDIAKITGEDICRATGLKPGELDLLDGSPPCQGFSSSGHRILDDPRNELFRQQIRLIRYLKPRFVVIENVAGMIKGKMKKVAGEIFHAIQSEGYHVSAGLIRATSFGVAQLRPRVFFVGSRDFKPKLPTPTHKHVISAGQALANVKPIVIEGVDHPGLLLPKGSVTRWMMDHLRPGEDGHECRVRHGIAGDSTSHFNFKMLHPKRPANTIQKSGGNTVMHWDRRLVAVNEALVLSGFPENYKLVGSRGKRFARIGNCVAPPVTTAIAKALMHQDRMMHGFGHT